MNSDDSDIEAPDLCTWLTSFLAVRRLEYEEQYRPSDPAVPSVERAIDDIERFAADLVMSGVISGELASRLQDFRPGEEDASKMRQLLRYQIVHHRLEFDVAEMVCGQLDGLDDRVLQSAILTMIMIGYRPAPTALKYFQRATLLYLAGYSAEAIVMCGAVLEAALRDRFTDDLLKADGMRPIFKRTGDYSVQQRLVYEAAHPMLTHEHRKMIRDILSWRNDAVHVQPDIGPEPITVLTKLALLLPVLFPSE